MRFLVLSAPVPLLFVSASGLGAAQSPFPVGDLRIEWTVPPSAVENRTLELNGTGRSVAEYRVGYRVGSPGGVCVGGAYLNVATVFLAFPSYAGASMGTQGAAIPADQLPTTVSAYRWSEGHKIDFSWAVPDVPVDANVTYTIQAKAEGFTGGACPTGPWMSPTPGQETLHVWLKRSAEAQSATGAVEAAPGPGLSLLAAGVLAGTAFRRRAAPA